jgi:hypothetical protein
VPWLLDARDRLSRLRVCSVIPRGTSSSAATACPAPRRSALVSNSQSHGLSGAVPRGGVGPRSALLFHCHLGRSAPQPSSTPSNSKGMNVVASSRAYATPAAQVRIAPPNNGKASQASHCLLHNAMPRALACECRVRPRAGMCMLPGARGYVYSLNLRMGEHRHLPVFCWKARGE